MQNVIFIVCVLIILQKLVLHFFMLNEHIHRTVDRGRQNTWGATSGTVTGSLWVPFTLAGSWNRH